MKSINCGTVVLWVIKGTLAQLMSRDMEKQACPEMQIDDTLYV